MRPEIDVLLFEPLSAVGRAALAHVRDTSHTTLRIAISDAHDAIPDDHGAHHLLVQPFAPADLRKLLDTVACRETESAA